MYNRPRGSFDDDWGICDYYKDIAKDKDFKVVKSCFVEVACTPEYALAEARWIHREADPNFMNIVVQIPVPFGRQAVIDFLNEFRNKKTGKLPKNLKGGRIMWIDETMDLSSTEGYQYGLEVMAEENLIWHMTGTPNFLPSIIKCVKKNPNNRFMIDHLCMEQGGEVYESWKKDITALAQCPNVFVNLGGCEIWDLVSSEPHQFLVYALEVLGYDRCCIGSNWY